MPLEAQLSVELMFGLLGAGVVVAVILSPRPRLCGWVSAALVAGAAGCAVWLGALGLGAGTECEGTYAHLDVVPASLTLHFTPLNVIFLWLILGLGLVATIYSVDYVEGVSRDRPGSPTITVIRTTPR